MSPSAPGSIAPNRYNCLASAGPADVWLPASTSASTSRRTAAPMINDLAKTPLHAWHVAHGGAWSISPAGRCRCSTRRSSTSTRPRAPRSACSTSRTWAGFASTGRRRAAFLDRLVTRRVADHEAGPDSLRAGDATRRAAFSTTCSSIAWPTTAGEPYYLMVVNASNREKIVDLDRSQSAPASRRAIRRSHARNRR